MLSDRLRIGSLFSGAGGLDMAVEHVLGGETVWHCETDPAASAVLAARWPGVPNLGDITAVDWSSVEGVDVLVGGFPCQDVSAAGRRAGIGARDDGGVTRSGLWVAMAIAIKKLQPVLVVIENVRGLLSAKAHRYLEQCDPALVDTIGGYDLRAAGSVLGDLADIGYDTHWQVVPASGAGAPHKRERVFVLAYPQKLGWETVGPVARAAAIAAADPRDAGPRREKDRLRGGQPDAAGGIVRDESPRCGEVEPADGQRARPQPGGRGQGAADAQEYGLEGRAAQAGRPEGRGDAAVGGEESVNLLPTPDARLGEHRNDTGQDPEKRRAQGHQVSLADELCYLPTLAAVDGSGAGSAQQSREALEEGRRQAHLTDLPRLLPTPSSSDGNGGRQRSQETLDAGTHQVNLTDLPRLLPTPNAQDGNGGGRYNSEGHQSTLPGTVREIDPLLPTPTANDQFPKNSQGEWNRHSPALTAVDHHFPDQPMLPTPKTTDHKTNASPGELSRHSPSLGAIEFYAAGGELPTPCARDYKGAESKGSDLTSALLPTPTSGDGMGGATRTVPDGNGGRRPVDWGDATTSTGDGGASRLRDVASNLLTADDALLHTPDTAPDAPNKGANGPCACGCPRTVHPHAGSCERCACGKFVRAEPKGLGNQVATLRTPNARDWKGGMAHQPDVLDQVKEAGPRWGKYEAAIRRWESLTRPAPAPTEPNKNGNPRLSARFSEWMMGWPSGHVTDLVTTLPTRQRPEGTIGRNEALKIVGNGVCPQQAMLALRLLMALGEEAAPPLA